MRSTQALFKRNIILIKLLFGIIFISLVFSYVIASPAAAQTILPPSRSGANCPPDTNCGEYGVNDFIIIGFNIAQFLWGISGSIALLFFMYGGVMFIISAGSTEKIGKARQIVVNSVVGLIVIFGSWLLVSYTFKALGVDKPWNSTDWFDGTVSTVGGGSSSGGGSSPGSVDVNIRGCCYVSFSDNPSMNYCRSMIQSECPVSCQGGDCVTFSSSPCPSSCN